MARRSYFSLVEPTWQTSCGGSAASSRYISYSLVPGGVFSRHGSSFVPVPRGASLIPNPPLRLSGQVPTVRA